MTHQLENLTTLRDAVEAGEYRDYRMAHNLFPDSWFRLDKAAQDKSTDAALQWLTVVLPDYVLHILSQRPVGVWAVVLMEIGPDGWHNERVHHQQTSHADNPATALILAGLNALIAQLQKEKDNE